MSRQARTSPVGQRLAGAAVGLVAGAGGLAAAANFLPWPVATGAGVLASAGGFAGTLLWERRAARRALDQAWRQATTGGPVEDPVTINDSLLNMLNPDQQVVAFNQLRERDLRHLLHWCASAEPQPRVWLVDGEPGSGKTRLLVEATTRLRDEGWWCGWVRRSHGAEAVEVARAASRPVLLVVDDADTRTDLAETLTAAVSNPADAVRMVVAAREFGPWWATLRAGLDSDGARLLPTAAATTIAALGDTGHGQRQLYVQALRAFARHIDKPEPEASLATDTPPATDLLLIHAAAAVTVHHQLTGQISLRTALAQLFTVEETSWQQSVVGTPLHDLGPGTLRAAVILAVLFGAEDRDDAIAMLRQLPGLAGTRTDVLGRLADWLRDLYSQASGRWLDPHLPARLAEHYAVTRLAASPPLLTAVADLADPATDRGHARSQRMLRILAHTASHTAAAVTVTTAIIRTNPTLLDTAVQVARTGVGPIDHAIAEAINALDLTSERLAELYTSVPSSTQSLAHTAVAIVAAQLDLADTDEDRAVHLNDLGFRLGQLGRWDEAVADTVDAVEIFRRLAATDAETYEPDLALVLINLGFGLTGLGRWEEALTATNDAVDITRRLATTDPDTYEPDLVRALSNLGGWLVDMGRWEEALTAATDAVEIARRLATTDPDTYELDLVRALHNLGAGLAGLGRWEEALTATTDAVEILRRLAATDPDAHEPTLAKALTNLGFELAGLRRWEEALTATTDAVEILRRLAATDPDAHEPALAKALTNLGGWLVDMGRWTEVLPAATEAVEIARRLAAANPDAHEPALGMALANLGFGLTGLGRSDDALAAATDAVEIFRRLAAVNPLAHEPILAKALTNVGLWLVGLNRWEEALTATNDAVEIARRLAATNPDAHEPVLGLALTNLGIGLSELSRSEEALIATTDAVTIYRRLNRRWPNAFRENLATAERNLRLLREALGQQAQDPVRISANRATDPTN